MSVRDKRIYHGLFVASSSSFFHSALSLPNPLLAPNPPAGPVDANGFAMISAGCGLAGGAARIGIPLAFGGAAFAGVDHALKPKLNAGDLADVDDTGGEMLAALDGRG